MSDILQLDYVTVDVFTRTKYKGNPLAIVKVPQSVTLSQAQKQTIAREFNYSETTFLHEETKDNAWTVDIFTTEAELPFAGHPTIGTACYVLSKASEGRVDKNEISGKFNLKAGEVILKYTGGVAKAAIPHNFHIHDGQWPLEKLLELQPRLAEAHRLGSIALPQDYPVVSVVKGMTFVLLELESEEALNLVTVAARGTKVDQLDSGWEDTFVGSYFYVRLGKTSDGAHAVRTRMIEAGLEDPATGSAACDLAGYISLKEGSPGETVRFAITQGVEMGRRSDIMIDVVMAEKTGINSVYLAGSAVAVMEGRLAV